MGGGGDVVGALATARLCQAFGAEFVLGGVAWERWPVDPHPGPRHLDEIRGGRPLSDCALLANERTVTPDGTPFAESRMAGYLCSDTVLIDIGGGVAELAAGLVDAAKRLGCDLAIFLDVGGDVLAHGEEPGLASPLCDAVMAAAAAEMADALPVLGGVYGAGCDGELSPTEVIDRIAALGRAGALLGGWGLTPALCEQIEQAARVVPTEASLMGVRCARGETGSVPIRGGRRTVELTPVGGLTFYFDPVTALDADLLPLAAAVRGAGSLEEAHEALSARGVGTELGLERARQRGEDPLRE